MTESRERPDAHDSPVDRRTGTDRYYDRLARGETTDWEVLMERDPEARDELKILSTIDKIRTAYCSAAPPVEPSETGDFPEEEAAAEDSSTRPEDRRTLRRFGDYEIVERIGKGGFASIYRAWDERAGREVALKILRFRKEMSEESVTRFLREARALARLDHENIVRIYHVIDENKVLGLCMELINGKSLSEIMKESGPLSPEDVVSTGIDLCGALTEVHNAGFIHRDIKAENIMRAEDGRIVLMDFGISRSLNATRRVTAMGVLVGTPLAMAPEQYEFKEVDARTDVYALGCLLYRLLTGVHPVRGETMEEIRRQVLEADYARIRELRPEVPESLERIIQRAMERAPRERYGSAAEMEQALRNWAGGRPDAKESRPPGKAYPALVVVLLVAILIALLAIIGLLIFGN